MSDFDPESTNLVFLGKNKTPIASVRYQHRGFIISNYVLARVIMDLNLKMPDFNLDDKLEETQKIDYFKNSSNQDVAEIIKKSIESMSDEKANTLIFANDTLKIYELMATSEKNIFIDLSKKIINLSPLVLDDRFDRFNAVLSGLNKFKADKQAQIGVLAFPIVKPNWKINKLTINQFYDLSWTIMQYQLQLAQNNKSTPAFILLTDNQDVKKSTLNWILVA